MVVPADVLAVRMMIVDFRQAWDGGFDQGEKRCVVHSQTILDNLIISRNVRNRIPISEIGILSVVCKMYLLT